MDALSAVRALHVLLGAFWFGAATFGAFVMGPVFMASGPAARPVMMTMLRRGGLARIFATIGILVVATGGYVYSQSGIHEDPFGTSYAALLTTGAVLAIVALAIALFVLWPNDRRMRAIVASFPATGPPPAEGVQRLQALGMRQGKLSALSAGLVVLTVLAMVGSRVF